MSKLYVTNKDKVKLLPPSCVKLCIARQPFIDMNGIYHILSLAPSDDLWRDYVKRKCITWDEYVERFKIEMIQMEKALQTVLKYLSHGEDVALICHCKLSMHCHRGILAKYFEEKEIEVVYI